MRLQNRRVLTSGVLGLGAALALAGCGAGQITQTDTMLPAVNGALAQVGKISVRNAGVVNTNKCDQAYPTGADAQLQATIANDGATDDELVSVSSANAANATIEGQKLIVAGSSLVVGPANSAESAATATATSSATPTSSPAGTPTSSAAGTPSSPASSSSSAAAGSSSGSPETGTQSRIGHVTLTLNGLKQVLWPGQLTPVTFVFRDAGPVTVEIPIAAPTVELPNCQTASQQAESGR